MDFHGPFVYVLAIPEPAPTGSYVQVGANDIGVPQATYPKSNNSASQFIRPAVVLDLWCCHYHHYYLLKICRGTRLERKAKTLLDVSNSYIE